MKLKTSLIPYTMRSPCLLLAILLLVASAIAQVPKKGTLATDTQIPLIIEGKTVGSMTLKAGSQVTITQILPNNDGVLITRGESATAKIPVEAISPASLQTAIVARNAILAAQTADVEAQTAKKAAEMAAKKAAEEALAKAYPGATAANKALYIKIESLIRNGKKRKDIRPEEQACPLSTYEYDPWGTNNPIGQVLHKWEVSKELGSHFNNQAEFKVVKMSGIVPDVTGKEIGEAILFPGKDILPEAFEKLLPKVKKLTTLEGKKVYLDNGGMARAWIYI